MGKSLDPKSAFLLIFICNNRLLGTYNYWLEKKIASNDLYLLMLVDFKGYHRQLRPQRALWDLDNWTLTVVINAFIAISLTNALGSNFQSNRYR